MNAPFNMTESLRAQLNLAAHLHDIERMARELTTCTMATDPDGYRGAALERSIEEAQEIVQRETLALTGLPLERIAQACGR